MCLSEYLQYVPGTSTQARPHMHHVPRRCSLHRNLARKGGAVTGPFMYPPPACPVEFAASLLFQFRRPQFGRPANRTRSANKVASSLPLQPCEIETLSPGSHPSRFRSNTLAQSVLPLVPPGPSIGATEYRTQNTQFTTSNNGTTPQPTHRPTSPPPVFDTLWTPERTRTWMRGAAAALPHPLSCTNWLTPCSRKSSNVP